MNVSKGLHLSRTIGWCLAALVLLAAAPAGTADLKAPFLLQKPTLSQTRIVFVFADDLWTVPREGGEAARLTSSPGLETNPVFSPDGSLVAFTGEYDGNVDVFIVPAAGGVPRRLTWHPAADTALGWTPDGKRVLFTSNRNAYSRFSELFTAGLDGGLEEKLPLPMGFEAAFSPDGKRLAYVPLGRAFTAWKRYRGGRATPIWIANLADSAVEKVPRADSNDFNPIWAGDKVYFLSDREGAVSLYVYDPASKKVSRAFENTGLDLKSASAGPGAIVYERFGGLGLYDLQTGKTAPVAVTVSGDMPDVRERYFAAGESLDAAGVSPNAARAVFQARGEIVTVPAEKGDPRNLTNTPGIDGARPGLVARRQDHRLLLGRVGRVHAPPQTPGRQGETVKIALAEKPTFYFSPALVPRFEEDRLQRRPSRPLVRRHRRQEGRPRGQGQVLERPGAAPAWSPDSKWLAYEKTPAELHGRDLPLLAGVGKSTQVTDGMSDARFPVFDADGKYLYFSASTDSGQSIQPDIHSIARPVTRSLYLAVLSKDEPSPFGPESDEEKGEEKKPAADKPAEQKPEEKKPAAKPAEPAKEPEAKPKSVAVKIDFDGILQRILALPMPARNYVNLQAGKAGTLLAIEAPSAIPGTAGAPGHDRPPL